MALASSQRCGQLEVDAGYFLSISGAAPTVSDQVEASMNPGSLWRSELSYMYDSRYSGYSGCSEVQSICRPSGQGLEYQWLRCADSTGCDKAIRFVLC